MAQQITTTNFSDFVANSLILFRKAFSEFPKVAGTLYDIEQTNLVTGEESSLDGFSVAKRKEEGGDFAFLDINQGYNKTWRIEEVGGMTKITWLMRVGNKYREMNDRISNLASSSAKRMEWDLTHRFTFGFQSSYVNLDGETVDITTGDGLSLFNTAHTVTGSATTYRNAVSGNPAISLAGLEAAEKLFATQMIDSNGETVFEQPDTIITTNDPTQINIALQYLHSTAAVDVDNSGVYNPYQSKYALIVLPYLSTDANGVYDSSKAKQWMLADLSRTDAICKILENPTFIPPTQNDGMEFETMDWKFASHAAYALEILRAQWVAGSNGTGV